MISFSAFSEELVKIAEERAKKVPLSDADRHLYKAIEKGSPVKVRITSEAVHYGGGFFDQEKKEIGLSEKNFEALAHEVGHAHLDEHLLGRIIQHQAVRGASSLIVGALAGIGAGILMAKGQRWGLLLPAALSAPTILSEMLATRKGGKRLEEEGATEEQKGRYHRQMREGLSTYFAAPAIGSLIAAGMQAR
jgi:hypothetical protein